MNRDTPIQLVPRICACGHSEVDHEPPSGEPGEVFGRCTQKVRVGRGSVTTLRQCPCKGLVEHTDRLHTNTSMPPGTITGLMRCSDPNYRQPVYVCGGAYSSCSGGCANHPS